VNRVVTLEALFDLTLQIEQNGARYYQRYAESKRDAERRNLLHLFAKVEGMHEQTFRDMKTSLMDVERTETIDPQGDALRYLIPSISLYEKEVDTTALQTILQETVQAEKDSSVFYIGFKDIITNPILKPQLEGIIKEELNHIKHIGIALLKVLE
jgi:rubrerythrin